MTDQQTQYNKLPSELLAQRYHAYSIELMAEALTKFAKVMRSPDAARGSLITTLEHLIASLREEPFVVVTNYERQVHLRSLELLDAAYLSVNGADTTEGRAKLFLIVEELRKLQ
jgi:hypothetical protein